MHFQLEVHEPFPDPSVVVHALDLESSALISDAKGDPMGKKPLRDIYDLYPDKLPSVIRDRLKIPFNERSGLDLGPSSVITRRFDDAISDSDFDDGQREFEAFDIRTKEEMCYLWTLCEHMDVFRVPHLRARMHVAIPSGAQRFNQAIL